MDVYAKRALDFVQDLQGVNDYDEICRRITTELEWFGYTHVTAWRLPGPGDGINDGMLLNTRPSAYNEHYERQNYLVKDPIILRLRETVKPFSWDDVRARRLSKQQCRIIDEGREFDARNGLIIPIVTRSGSLAIFSPCGREPDITPRARAAIELIGIYANQALQRAVVQSDRDTRPTARLSPRERDVVKWVAAGKTDDEIATILNLSRDTVTDYVESAKRKLDATRRTYAVVQALRFGEIHL